MAFIVHDMSCIYIQYNLEVPLRSSASYRKTSLCLQRHSEEGLLVWWQALQQVPVLSLHVLPPPLEKSHLTDLTFWRLQWGTKVLRHFRKMAPFCIVDILIPFSCLPQPLFPKINVEFWTLKSFFHLRQHWFGAWGDLQRLKRMK